MKRELSIDICGFRKIREGNYYYVDKTRMIEDVIKTKNEITLITRPHQFGKTTNLTMIQEFFDITKDSRSLFTGLTITDTPYVEQMNTRPVIYLPLRECIGKSVEEIEFKIAEQIAEEYEKYDVLFEQRKFNRNRSVYRRFYATHDMLDEMVLYGGDVNHDLLTGSLTCLMKALHTYYQKKPLLLIDEYDQPLMSARRQGFRDKMRNFFRALFGEACGENESFKQAVITGSQGMEREKVFSKRRNISVCTIGNKLYAMHFGFTLDEVKELFAYYEIHVRIEDVYALYEGYTFGHHQQMYHPKSIFTFVRDMHAIWSGMMDLPKEKISS